MTASATNWHARKDPRFIAFLAGVVTNNLGEGIYKVALPLLAYSLTGSLAVMALVAAATPIALLLGGPLFGYIADRYGTRVLVVPGLAVQCVAALVLALSLLNGGKPTIALLAASEFFIQLGGAMYRAGWFASVPGLFPTEPGRARGLLATSYQATEMLGPLLAGLLIAVLGIPGLVWINVATFLAPMGVWIAGVRVPREQDGGTLPHGLWGSLGEGWQVLRHSRRVFTTMLLLVPCSLLASSATLALGLFYLRDRLDVSESMVGIAVALINVGALFGAASAARRHHMRLRTIAYAALGTMAGSLFLAPLPMTAVVVGALAMLFAAEALLSTSAEVALYNSLPREAIGRTYGFFRLVLGTAAMLAPAVIAVSDVLLDVRAVFVVLGLFAVAPLAWLLLRSPSEWDLVPESASKPALPDSPPASDSPRQQDPQTSAPREDST
ncbi:MFS transporter [Actinopolyspora halophila]|uniref:MFS transporter n=1 Tax=Actinopolyspora halophila TaxID=1850 RepID=UPI00035EA485|nr:MFS transporter [Actinopolyspora halophila]